MCEPVGSICWVYITCLPAAVAADTRLSGLDLVNRDHMVLMDASHSFPIGPDLEQLLKTVYASAAAVLALLADQIADRGAKEQGCNAATAVLQVRCCRVAADCVSVHVRDPVYACWVPPSILYRCWILLIIPRHRALPLSCWAHSSC